MSTIKKENILRTIFSLTNPNSITNLPDSYYEKRERNLGRGFTLELLTEADLKGLKESNRDDYCYLYKDGTKVSDTIFRLGGLSSGFNKKEYCMLIKYELVNGKMNYGNHCIVDLDGKIVMEAEPFESSFYYLKGVICVKKETYYNLLTGKPIANGHQSVNSDNYLFVKNGYKTGFEEGVYKIEYATGNFEIFK